MRLALASLAVLATSASVLAQPATTPLFWPDKNGPTYDCLVPAAEAARVPTEWDEASKKNIVWRTELPAEETGHSTPVIGGDLIWFTSATVDGTKQFVNCIDRHSGKVLRHELLWENTAPEELGNPINNYAAPSAVLEADAVYVHCGTYGTARLDPLTGKQVWTRRDINVRHFRGPGSSPALFENLLILTFDGINRQFVTALDKATGTTVWQTPRSTDYGDLDKEGKPTRDGDMRKAYHTPTFAKVGSSIQMISVGSRAAFGYDPKTGKELWTIRHGGFNAAPRVLATADMLFINTGSERSHMLGVRIDDKMTGDITSSHVVWDHDKRNASESSPVLLNGLLFQNTRGGIITCLDAKTGADIWEERLQGQYLPSPICAGDRLYYANDRGETSVVRAAGKYELIATNTLVGGADAKCSAGMAVADGALFIRTKSALYKIAK